MRSIGTDRAGREASRPLRRVDYRALAAFRTSLRRFLRASAERARAVGISAQQHQLLLAIQGHAGDTPPGMGELAEALQVRPHTAVGLADRASRAGLVRRIAVSADHRRVGLVLRPRGERLLARLTEANRIELARLRVLLGRVAWGRAPGSGVSPSRGPRGGAVPRRRRRSRPAP
jgi:DNA-binding MarR family transcriptional regulator